MTGDGPTERVAGLRVSGNLFATLGVQAAVGRTLAAADDTPGQEKVVVLTHGLWQRFHCVSKRPSWSVNPRKPARS